MTESTTLVELDDDARAWWPVLVEARRKIAEGKHLEGLALDHLKPAVGSAEGATIGGELVIRYGESTTTRVDLTALKADHPELIAQYAKTSVVRSFRPILPDVDSTPDRGES